jgi:hypothetical protein
MDREQLVALRDAIDTVLTWSDDVRAEIARWLAPDDLAQSYAPGEKTAKQNKDEQSAGAQNYAPKPPPSALRSSAALAARRKAAVRASVAA